MRGVPGASVGESVVNEVPALLGILASDASLLWCNDRWVDFMGLSVADLLGPRLARTGY